MAIEVEAPNGDIIEFPNGTPPATIKKVMAARYGGPKGGKKPAPKKAGAVETALSGFRTGLKDITENIPSPLNYLTELTMSPEKRAVIERGLRGLDVRAREIEAQRPYLYGGARVGGQVVATAPVLNALAAGLGLAGQTVSRVAPRVSKFVQETARLVPTGGFGAKTAGTRIAAGGTAGAATAGVSNQDMLEGGAIGAGIPVIGNILGRTFGAGYDIVARRVGKTKAAEMLRKAIGDSMGKVQAALRRASPAERATLIEFLESKNIKIPELAALEKNIRQSTANKPLREQAARVEQELAALRVEARRGGATATEAEKIVAQRRKKLMEGTEVQRQAGIEAMDVGRTQIIPAERRAAAATKTAEELQNEARRLTGAAEFFEKSPMFTRGADEATYGAEQALEEARAATQMAESLRQQGYQPIDIRPLVQSLRSSADEIEFVNPDRYSILSDFANRLEARAQKFGGIIDAAGFYEARKDLGNSINRLLAGRDPDTRKKATASILGQIRPEIDRAIKAAGGDKLLQSIETVSKGLTDLEQQTVANALTRLQQKRPEIFTRIMAGEEPGAVRILTQGGTGDVTEALGPRLPYMQELTKPTEAIVQRGKFYIPDEMPMAADYRRGVAAEAADIMQAGLPFGIRATSRLMEAKLPGGGRAGAVLEGRYGDYMQQKILGELSPMLASPQNAMLGMKALPASETMANYIQGLSPTARNAFARAVLSGSLYGAQPNY